MSATDVIDQIKQLPDPERKLVIAFVHSLEDDDWDRTIAADAAAGHLDFLKEQAQKAVRENRLQPLP